MSVCVIVNGTVLRQDSRCNAVEENSGLVPFSQSRCVSTYQQGHVGSKTWLQQSPLVLIWEVLANADYFVMSECSLSGRGQGHVSNFYIVDLENFATASLR